ncbi:MAG: DUF6702 family protein [Saprospiraceae bacterium]
MMPFIFYICFLPSFVSDHEIHLSVTEIHRSGDAIEVVSKVFLDDLQNAMGLVPGEELPDNYKGADDLIQRFIDKNLFITLNGQIIRLKLTDTEAALPAIWATFHSENVEWKAKNILVIENKIMIDKFDDQKNITKVEVGHFKKEIIFTTVNSINTLNF